MTAVVGVLNKAGVAIAADSAVTVTSQKRRRFYLDKTKTLFSTRTQSTLFCELFQKHFNMTLFAKNHSTYNSKKVEHLNLFEILMANKEKPTFTPDMDSETIVKIIVDSMLVELHKEFERVGLKPKSTNIENSATAQ